MQLNRLFLLLCAFFMFLAVNSHAEITYWVDENGVRHYSNADTSVEDKEVKSIEEYRQNQSNEDGKSVKKRRSELLDMYKEDKKRELEEKRQKDEERAERSREKAKKAADEKKARLCAEAKQNLEELRELGWKNFESADIEQHVREYRFSVDHHGVTHDNNAQRIADRNKARKKAYDRAVREREKRVQHLCEE